MSNLEDTFGAWLKLVLPNSGMTERDQRLGVVRTFADTISKKDLLGLTFAFYSEPTTTPVIERLRAAMRDVDTSFGPKDNAELAVLAAGVLFAVLDKGQSRKRVGKTPFVVEQNAREVFRAYCEELTTVFVIPTHSVSPCFSRLCERCLVHDIYARTVIRLFL